MLTLKHLNLNEEELGLMLNFIYEAEEHPEKDLYAQFIDEATLDQKLGLLVMELKDVSKQGHLLKSTASYAGRALLPFWTAYRVIRAFMEKCSRKCGAISGNTFMRQKCMAKCKSDEAAKSLAATGKIQCGGDKKCEEKKKSLQAKWKTKATAAAQKAQRYTEKHKKLAFTV